MKISVCIATYNGEKYIAEQLESILIQIGDQDEVIVSDDGSSDKTIEVIKAFNDSRIRIFFNNGKRGYTSNFENALTKANGDIIFLSDQDDVWLPGKYDDVTGLLEKYDLVVTDSKVTDEYLNITHDSFFDLYSSGEGIIKNAIRNTYYGSCMALKRKILDYAMPFPKNDNIGFDIWIGFVAEIIGKVYFLKKTYLLYRKSESSITVVGGSFLNRSDKPFSEKILKRFIILYYTLSFWIKFKFIIKNKKY